MAAKAYGLIEKEPQERLRCAALAGLVAAVPSEAAERLKKALGDSELNIRGVAAQLVRDTARSNLIDVLAQALPQLSPLAKQTLLEALGSRTERSALAAVRLALKQQDVAVRIAAIGTLGRIGRAEDVSTLIDHLPAATSGVVRDALLQSLRAIRGPSASAAIAAGLFGRDPATTKQLVLVIVAREDASSAPALLKAAESGDPTVRLESLKALQELAGHSFAPALVALLAKTPPGEARDAAQQAVILACMKAPDSGRRAEPILSAMRSGDLSTRCALLPALGALGGSAARDAIWRRSAIRRQPRKWPA